jgi:hypothetical protein
MDGNPALQAQVVLCSGFGALVAGMFGMGWLGSGLGIAHAFTPAVIVLFDVFGILLLGSSIYFIRKGRSLRRNCPASHDARIKRINKQFIVIVILEFTAIAVLSTAAYVFHRPDLAPVLAAIVVGLHFLPLGKIFRQARYHFGGIAITIWRSVCAIFIPFQYAYGVEQHRDGCSTLGKLRARSTASPRNRVCTCPVTRLTPDT